MVMMPTENQQISPCRPRRLWPLVGVACFAGLSLIVYLALVAYGIWQSRRQSDRSVSTCVAPAQPMLTVSPRDIDANQELDAFDADVTGSLQSRSKLETQIRGGERGRIESPKEAAEFGASLANQECQRIWRHTPFEPNMYPANMENGQWLWGGYDPFGPEGFSAEVSFGQDGSGAKVQINFTTDAEIDWSGGEGNRENSPEVPDAIDR